MLFSFSSSSRSFASLPFLFLSFYHCFYLLYFFHLNATDEEYYDDDDDDFEGDDALDGMEFNLDLEELMTSEGTEKEGSAVSALKKSISHTDVQLCTCNNMCVLRQTKKFSCGINRYTSYTMKYLL